MILLKICGQVRNCQKQCNKKIFWNPALLFKFCFNRPRLVWGNQDPMRPISSAAMNATVSARVNDLATPKKNFQLDSPQKCSRWVNKLYPADKILFQLIKKVKNARIWSFSRCLFLPYRDWMWTFIGNYWNTGKEGTD